MLILFIYLSISNLSIFVSQIIILVNRDKICSMLNIYYIIEYKYETKPFTLIFRIFEAKLSIFCQEMLINSIFFT